MSQNDLARELCRVSRRDTVTRNHVSRWENENRTPQFWLPYLADVLQAPWQVLEDERLNRRTFISDIAVLGAAPLLPAQFKQAGEEIFSSIAAGDYGPLATIQTSHRTDLQLAYCAMGDKFSFMRLRKWMDDGESAVVRVNAAGILAKTPGAETADQVVASLIRDEDARFKYVTAVRARVGTRAPALLKELSNPRDAGARFCSAVLLSQRHGEVPQEALISALRSEPSREIIRTIALSMNGATPWS